ncbi:conserved hypothetical protein [Trichinella spiralis]|uniref:hypothetical protein n=1 Tax=Trichinella spiralis TaxID=6334 RepID=UPI0001EFBEDB|nr:conserved hypothetical protein [Trichinella spiralis]
MRSFELVEEHALEEVGGKNGLIQILKLSHKHPSPASAYALTETSLLLLLAEYKMPGKYNNEKAESKLPAWRFFDRRVTETGKSICKSNILFVGRADPRLRN